MGIVLRQGPNTAPVAQFTRTPRINRRRRTKRTLKEITKVQGLLRNSSLADTVEVKLLHVPSKKHGRSGPSPSSELTLQTLQHCKTNFPTMYTLLLAFFFSRGVPRAERVAGPLHRNSLHISKNRKGVAEPLQTFLLHFSEDRDGVAEPLHKSLLHFSENHELTDKTLNPNPRTDQSSFPLFPRGF